MYLRAKNRFYEESKKIPERFDNKSIYQYVDKSINSFSSVGRNSINFVCIINNFPYSGYMIIFKEQR